MKPIVQRRELTNYVVDRGALTRLSIPFVTLAAIAIAIVWLIRWKVMTALESIELSGAENLPAINSLHDMQSQITLIGGLGVLLIAAVCLGFWIVASHRIFGPTVPLRRHVRNLIDGDYASRVQLRQSDELQDLADELNHLAETLKFKTTP